MEKKDQIERKSAKNIKKGALISYISIFINILAGIFYTPWMIEKIGQSNFGLYTLAISIISMFMIDFGFGAAVSRFLSMYLAKNRDDLINKMLSITYKIYLLIDFIILLILVVIYFNIDSIFLELSNEEIAKFKVVYTIAALFSVVSFPFLTLNGILTAYEEFFKLKLYDLFNRVFSIILIIWALINDNGLYALVTVNAISGMITIIFKFITVRNITQIKIDFTYKDKNLLKEIFGFSIWSGIAGISQRFIFNITPSILGSLSGTINVAIFGVAAAIEGYIFTIANAINGLFLPKVSRIINKKQNKEKYILELMIKIGRIQLYIIGTIVVGFILLGYDFIMLWVGYKYEKAYLSVVLLILPSIVYLPQHIGNTAVIALNKVRLQGIVFVIMAIVNILLSLILTPIWNVIGASFAIFIAYFVRNIGMNIIYYKVLKINVFEYFKNCHIKLLVPFLIIGFFSFIIFYLIAELSWINFILRGFIYMCICCLVFWFLSFNKYEKHLVIELTNFIRKKVGR